MGFLAALLGPGVIETCPACGQDASRHARRTLARERFAPGLSGIESLLEQGRFEEAARLDDKSALGDLLVHVLLRCQRGASIITVEEPAAFGLEPRIRRTTLLQADDADRAFTAAP